MKMTYELANLLRRFYKDRRRLATILGDQPYFTKDEESHRQNIQLAKEYFEYTCRELEEYIKDNYKLDTAKLAQHGIIFGLDNEEE